MGNLYAPISHASSSTTYGVGTSSNYGHLKISDNYTSSAGSASDGIAASSSAVYNTYNNFNSKALLRYTNLTSDATTSLFGSYRAANGITDFPVDAGGILVSFQSLDNVVFQIGGSYMTRPLYYRTQWYGTWYDWFLNVSCASGGVGSSTKPVYVNSNGTATACSDMMPLTGSTFTGVAYAQTNTSYTTYQLRNIAFTTSTPNSLTNGNICMVYS